MNFGSVDRPNGVISEPSIRSGRLLKYFLAKIKNLLEKKKPCFLGKWKMQAKMCKLPKYNL